MGSSANRPFRIRSAGINVMRLFTSMRSSAAKLAASASHRGESAPARASRPTRRMSRIGAASGFVATELYWLYVIFFASIVNPVSVYVVDRQTGLHLLSGQVGNLESTLNWSSVSIAVLLSLLVFASTWLAVRIIANALATTTPILSSRPARAV